MGFVAANIRALRRARGMTQEALAERAEIEVRHLSELENARRTPSFALIVRLADELGVEAFELFRKRSFSENPKGRPPKVMRKDRSDR
jgi:transcriptional regulator with XRE-family HTH domain